jgi:hypothetical protein
MPVLDAKALKTDPKGAAFLLSVLRRSPSSVSNTAMKPRPVWVRPAKPHDEILQASPSDVSA